MKVPVLSVAQAAGVSGFPLEANHSELYHLKAPRVCTFPPASVGCIKVVLQEAPLLQVTSLVQAHRSDMPPP